MSYGHLLVVKHLPNVHEALDFTHSTGGRGRGKHIDNKGSHYAIANLFIPTLKFLFPQRQISYDRSIDKIFLLEAINKIISYLITYFYDTQNQNVF